MPGKIFQKRFETFTQNLCEIGFEMFLQLRAPREFNSLSFEFICSVRIRSRKKVIADLPEQSQTWFYSPKTLATFDRLLQSFSGFYSAPRRDVECEILRPFYSKFKKIFKNFLSSLEQVEEDRCNKLESGFG